MARALTLLGVWAAAGCFHATSYSPGHMQANWRSMRDRQAPRSRSATEPSGPGLTADEAYAMALQSSPDLAAAEARAAAATAGVKEAGQIDNPQLRFTGFNVDDVIANKGSMNVGLRVPIPRPGTVRAAVDGAKQAAQGEASWTDDAKRLLHARIDTLYARLAMHRADLELAAEGKALRSLRLDQVTARAELGAATKLDVAMAGVLQEQAVQTEAVIRDEIAAVEGELQRLIGASGPVSFAVDPGVLRVVDADVDATILAERAMAERPELRATHAAIALAESEAFIAKSQAWPWFDWAQVQYQAAAGAGPTAFGFGVALTLPIFSWNRGAIRTAKANVRVREQEQRAQILTIAGEVEEAAQRVEQTAKRVVALEHDLLPKVEAAGRELEAAVAAGVFDPEVANDVDTQVIEAKRLHLAALLEHREAVIDLEAAVGVAIVDEKGDRP